MKERRTCYPEFLVSFVFTPILSVIIWLFAFVPSGQAHAGEPPAPHDLWYTWNWEPPLLLGLLLTGWLYLRSVCSLWGRAGVGHGTTLWHVAAFIGGLMALFIALISPLDALGEALFSGHMVQHMVLIFIAAPLLVLGAQPSLTIWVLPQNWRRPVGWWWREHRSLEKGWDILSRPLMVGVVYAVILWSWHIPILYDLSLSSEWAHAAMHSSFLGSSFLFWWVVIRSFKVRHSNIVVNVLFVFLTMLHSFALGMLFTSSTSAWYRSYSTTTYAWNLSPVVDQQIAGAIMTLPAAAIHMATILAVLAKWLLDIEKENGQTFEARKTISNTRTDK